MTLTLALCTGVLVAMTTVCFARAQPPAGAPGVAFYEVEHGGQRMRAAVYVPWNLARVPAGERPALLFLHGYGESGTDGTRQLAVGLPPAALLDAEAWPFVIIAPQKPVHDAEWGAFEPLVLAALERGIAMGGADARRVAITGLSQGGHGTIALATAHPGRFVAAAPVCGYIKPRFYADGLRPVRTARVDDDQTRAVADRAGHLPWRIYHGALDEVVPVGESRVLAQALASAGADVELVEYDDLMHNSWDRAYRESGLAAFLRGVLSVE